MTEHIQGGGFFIARKMYRSPIWLKHPLYLKAWIWILGRASYEDHDRNGFQYRRGEFVTTYDEIIKATAYRYKRKHIFPTIKQIRTILEWFVSEEMIIVEPVRDSELPIRADIRADIRARTRAYVGLKIFVVNYNTYQDSENYKGRHKGRRSGTNKGTIIKRDYKKGNNILSEISVLKERYSDQELVDRAFQAIASTRKSNRVANSILLSQLQKWEKYPVDHVQAGIRIYLEKECAADGKGEKYLLGIIRNHKPVDQKPTSTGSSLLDSYYASNPG